MSKDVAYDNCPPDAAHTCGECNRILPHPMSDGDES